MTTFAHISDLHLPPLPPVKPAMLASKRLLGYLSWHRKRKHLHRAEVLTALAADLAGLAPDHICVTGDLTNLALPAEFAAAANWLRALGDPTAISIVPGNHDAYVRSGAAQGLQVLAPWIRDDDGRAAWPYLRRRGRLSFIGVNTAVPTAPFLASGRVGPDQAARLRALLLREGGQRRLRVVLMHHPPQAGIVSARKALSDAPALREVLHAAGAELVLHGHAHRAVRATLPGPAGEIPVLGAASASMDGGGREAGQYHLIRLERAGCFVVELRQYDASLRRFAMLHAPIRLARGDGGKVEVMNA